MTKVQQFLSVLAVFVLVTTAIGAGFAGAAVANDDEIAADLEIDQPHYVDGDVNIDTSGNYTTYDVSGPSHTLALGSLPENSSVIDYGVEEDEGSLSDHSATGLYNFDAEGDGTYHVYFVVEYDETTEEEVDDDNGNTTETTTETVRERHVAQLSVSESDIQAVSADRLDDYRTAADNWSAWESDLEGIVGPDVNVDQQTELAGTLLDIRHNPGKALTGEFFGVVLMLFITTSGLAVLALFGFYHLFVTRKLRKRTNERETLEVEEADLEEKLIELDDKERNRVLVNTTMLDWLDDEWSGRAMHEDLGEDAMSAYLNFAQIIGSGNIVHDRLLAMGKDGYRAAVSGDGLGTDDPTYTNARLVNPAVEPDLRDGEQLVDLDDDETAGAIAGVIDPDDSDLFEYDLRSHETRLCEMGPELRSPESVDELVEELDADLRRFQGNEKAYAKYLLEFVEHVREHQFTDAHGRPKDIRYVLSSWLKTAQIGRDIFQMPTSEMHVEYLEKLLQDHDPAEDAQIEIDQQRKGVSGSAAD